MLLRKLEKGELSIFDDVVRVITGMAINEVSGVEVSTSLKGLLLDKVKRNQHFISIETSNERVKIFLKVGITYGQNIAKVIQELQQVVKNHVEMFTNFTVEEVNVLVNQIIIAE